MGILRIPKKINTSIKVLPYIFHSLLTMSSVMLVSKVNITVWLYGNVPVMSVVRIPIEFTKDS